MGGQPTNGYTIDEAAARTGLSNHTLRYYEREGLLPPVAKATSGHRRYSDDDLGWVGMLQLLRATGDADPRGEGVRHPHVLG